MLSRRRFLEIGSVGLVAVPLSAAAQPSSSRRRIGGLLVLLSPAGREVRAFQQARRDVGYVEGRDLVIEWRSASRDVTRLPHLAAELVERKVEVIVADTTSATRRPSARRPPFRSL